MSKSMIRVINTHTFEADFTGERTLEDGSNATFVGYCSERDGYKNLNTLTSDDIFALPIWSIMVIIESPDGKEKAMMYPKGSKTHNFSMLDAMNGDYDDVLNFCTTY